MNETQQQPASWDIAWLALCLALGFHVVDEATNDFLSLYNPTAQSIRATFPWLPIPIFTFQVWLSGLILAVVLLLSLPSFAFRNSPRLRPLAWFFAVLMAANALGHFGSSIYLNRLAPGVVSSPLLLAASLYLVAQLRRTRAAQRALR